MTGPENSAHLGTEVTAVDTADLIAAFGAPASVTDVSSLRSYVTTRQRKALWPWDNWASTSRGTDVEKAILAAADAILASPPEITGADLGRSQRYGFHYLGWLEPLARAWALTHDPYYAHGFEKLFLDWDRHRRGIVGGWPGLDLVWYSLGIWARGQFLLPALDSLAAEVSDTCWRTAMSVLVGGARWCVQEHDRFRHGNWQLVAATYLAHIAAVYPDCTESTVWREVALARLHEHLVLDVYPDGGHHERSPGYHELCLQNLQLVAGLERRYDLDWGIADHPRLPAMHKWIAELTTPSGWVPHLQDSSVVWSAPLLVLGGTLMGDHSLYCKGKSLLRTGDQVPEAGLFEPPRQSAEQAEDTSCVLLETSGYVLLRSRDGLRVVINAGCYVDHELESHSHAPVLDFVLDNGSRPLLWEAGGPPTYDDPDYHAWFQAPRGHNTVLVGDEPARTERDVQTELFLSLPDIAVFRATHQTFGIVQRREFILVRSSPDYLLVRDDAEASAHEDFTLVLHSLAPWREHGRTWLSDGVALWCAQQDLLASQGQGTARIPDAATHTADYGTLFSLLLNQHTPTFTTVVTTDETAIYGGDSAGITVSHDHVHDRLTAQEFRRTIGKKTTWLAVWEANDIDTSPRISFSTKAHAQWTALDGGWSLDVVTTQRCTVSCASTMLAPILNGVPLPDGSSVTIPHAGQWRLTAENDAKESP